jgi:hypothetical protein
MVHKEVSTRMYSELVRQIVGDVQIDTPDIKGVVTFNRVKKNEQGFCLYGGEVDITFKGEILSAMDEFYDVNRFRPVKIRKYLRINLEKTLSMYIRPFGISSVQIKNIKFES